MARDTAELTDEQWEKSVPLFPAPQQFPLMLGRPSMTSESRERSQHCDRPLTSLGVSCGVSKDQMSSESPTQLVRRRSFPAMLR